MQNSAVVIIHRRIIILIQHAAVYQLLNGFLSQVRVDGTGPIPQQSGEMMHLPGLAGFQNQSHAGPLFRFHQMLV